MITLTVELTPYEARALCRMGEMWAGILDGLHDHERVLALPEGHKVVPLESAVMKLETALVCAQEEVS